MPSFCVLLRADADMRSCTCSKASTHCSLSVTVAESRQTAQVLRQQSAVRMAIFVMQGELDGEDPDTELLKEQMRVIADELDRKEAALEALQNNESGDNVDVELQVCSSDASLTLLAVNNTPGFTCTAGVFIQSNYFLL